MTADEVKAIYKDTVRLLCPEGGNRVSFDGHEVEADEEGIVTVAAHAVPELMAHGFRAAAASVVKDVANAVLKHEESKDAPKPAELPPKDAPKPVPSWAKK